MAARTRSLRLLLFSLTAAVGAGAGAGSGSASHEVAPDHPRVFVFGENPLYPCFRVPGLVSAPNGTLLAFAEARRYTGDGCIPKAIKATGVGSALAMKRSDDGGRSWYPKGGRIVSPAGFDESAVFDARRGAVTLLYPPTYTTKLNAQRRSTYLGKATSERPRDARATP